MNEYRIVKVARSSGEREYLASRVKMCKESAVTVADHMNKVIPSATHLYRAERCIG